MKLWGVLTEDGVGDLIQGTDWRRTEDGTAQIKAMNGEWIDVFSVFECDNINFLY